jgi:hypothetical protein
VTILFQVSAVSRILSAEAPLLDEAPVGASAEAPDARRSATVGVGAEATASVTIEACAAAPDVEVSLYF